MLAWLYKEWMHINRVLKLGLKMSDEYILYNQILDW